MVHSCTSAFEVGLGPRAEMRDHFGRGDRAGPQAACADRGRGARGEEAGGEQVAGAGRVDDLADRRGGNSIRSPPSMRERAVGAAGDDQGRHLGGSSVSASSRSVRAGQLQRFVLIGEQQVDRRRCRSSARSLRGGRRCTRFRDRVKATLRPAAWAISIASQHRRARLVRAPQIAFEVEDRRRARSGRVVERCGAELVARAGAGVHRPLRVGRDEDQAAPGRRRRRSSGGVSKCTPSACMSCAKMSPSWSSATWPMNAGLAAHRGDPGHRIGGRSAAEFRAHCPSPRRARRPASGSSSCIDPWAGRAR